MERVVYQGTNVSNVLTGCLGTAREVLLGNGTCDDFMGNGTCGDFMGNGTCDDLGWGEWNIEGYFEYRTHGAYKSDVWFEKNSQKNY